MQLRAAAFAALVSIVPAAAIAQDDLTSPREILREQIPAGSWLRILTLKGDIEVREGSGRIAVVRAVRGRGRIDSDAPSFEVKRDGSNVTVCAIYPQTTRCDSEGYRSEGNRRDRDYASANFIVELPRGVKLTANTGNGNVESRGATAEVRASSGNGEITVAGSGGRVSASSGNGDIEVSDATGDVTASTGNGDVTVLTSSGPVSASSGNGRITVRMDKVDPSGDMDFSTGNGSIEVSLPANISADIVANVPLRRFETDFPMELPGRFSGGRIEGKIGQGGRRIRMSTGNGRVTIRKNG